MANVIGLAPVMGGAIRMALLAAGTDLGQERKNSEEAIWGLWLLG